MEFTWRAILWRQFGAAIDMLDNTLVACPDELWGDGSQNPPFWYIAYHTIFWLDLYLTGSEEGFVPPAPFTLSELDPAGQLPDRVYRKDELRAYLLHCRQECQATIETMTDDRAFLPHSHRGMCFAELLLYTMRHVQEHGGQLSHIVGQRFDWDASWVRQAKS